MTTGLQMDTHGHVVMALSPNNVPGCVQNLAIGAGSVQSAAFTVMTPYIGASDSGVIVPGPTGATHVRLVSTVDCFVMLGNAPFTVSATNGMFLPASSPEYFPVDVGDFVFVIQSTGAGTLNIVECE